MIELGVNIDHVATLRQQRLTTYPDPVRAALCAEDAGADNNHFVIRKDSGRTPGLIGGESRHVHATASWVVGDACKLSDRELWLGSSLCRRLLRWDCMKRTILRVS